MLGLFQFCCGFSHLGSLVTDDAALTGHESPTSSGRERGGRHRIRCRKSGALILCLLAAMPFNASRAEEPGFDIDIPAMNAAEALNRLAEQTGSVMLFAYDLARTRRANAVRGRYTLLEGLELLLRDTGLSGGISDKRLVVIAEDGNVLAGKGENVKKRGLIASFIAVLVGSTAADVKADQDPGASKLEEIVVTAQKREERVKDVPISISVLGGDDLDKLPVQGTTEALSRVPGLATTVNQQGGETLVTVRGVAAAVAQANGASPNAYYLDSVPFGLVKSAVGPDANPYDLERVEVLRGPQGTLYGASALNGVVRILTRDADLDEFEFKARASASSTKGGDENYRGDMAANFPLISGKLAARAVVGYESLSGWINRPALGLKNANDSTISNARLKIGSQPTDRLAIDLSAWMTRIDLDQLPVGGTNEETAALIAEPAGTDYDAYGLTVGYDFSQFSVTSTTSYLDYENHSDLAIATLNLFTGFDSHVFAEELILNSTGEGAWRWSIGGFYRDAEDRQLTTLPCIPDCIPAPIDFNNRSESIAIFGEVTRLFLDGRFELTAGLRHFEDEVTQNENVRFTGVPTEPLYNVTSDFDADSPRIVLTWHPNEQLTVYGSYAEGFRSGFNQDADVIFVAPGLPPVKPDTIKNYEVGAKGASADQRVSFDAAVYFIDWQDVQQSLAIPFVGSFVTAPINGDSASGIGVDFAIVAQPSESFQLSANFGWNDLGMDTDVLSEGVLLFEEGDRLSYSPEWTAGLSADYSFPLGSNGYEGLIGASANYTSEREVRTVVGGVQTIWAGDPLTYARASFSIASPNRWTATLFAENLNDEDGVPIRNIFNNPNRTVHPRPRTIGLQFDYRY